MPAFARTTRQQLRVFAVLYAAYVSAEGLHGYVIKQRAGATGPCVYRILDRLRELDLVDARWEARSDEPRPRRRCYWLSAAGAVEVRGVLAVRRPGVLAEIEARVQRPAL